MFRALFSRRMAQKLALASACFLIWQQFAPDALARGDCAEMLKHTGEPRYRDEREGTKTLCRLGYVLSHNPQTKTSDWVVEILVPERFKGPGDRTGKKFSEDPDLDEDEGAKDKDYLNSGYARGHMAPAEDMSFDQDAMDQSFYISNAAPQIAGLNGGIWAQLELLARNWTCERGLVVAITGPIYDSEKPKKLGESKRVLIPTAFYKIVYDVKRQRAVGFVLPNAKPDAKGKNSYERLKTYIVPIQEIEERVNLEFFRDIPARKRRILTETKSSIWANRGRCDKT